MTSDEMSFNRGVVRPIECMRAAWWLVKNDYWLFLGILFVGVLLASVGPMGVLLGPAMCGIHLCLLRLERGRVVSFDMLFQGFNYFVQSLIATLIMLVPMIILILIIYVFYFVGIFLIVTQQAAGGPPNETTLLLFVVLVVMVTLAILFCSFVMQSLFFFTYPLIVDRELSGYEAVRMSFRATFGNLRGVMGLVLLTMLIDLLGVLACYIGVIFLMPLHYAMVTIAYRQVFPAYDALARFRENDEDEDADQRADSSRETGIKTTGAIRPPIARPAEEPES